MTDRHGRKPIATTAVGADPLTRRLLLGIAGAITLILIVAPLAIIIYHAFASGLAAYAHALTEPATLHAIGLTTLTALVVVPINVLFGIAAAWTVTRFEFRGRRLLLTLIELPYSVSPIVAGVAYLFVYGAQGLFGPWLEHAGIKIMFALPAIFLASMFVTAPFVARTLIPLMQIQGRDEEEAAISLGATERTMFFRVTLPNIRWALIYGAILCNARVVGEFGAVSVVSGNIRGATNTLPLQIELLYQDYNPTGAFVVSSVLMLVAMLTILVRIYFEAREEQDRK